MLLPDGKKNCGGKGKPIEHKKKKKANLGKKGSFVVEKEKRILFEKARWGGISEKIHHIQGGALLCEKLMAFKGNLVAVGDFKGRVPGEEGPSLDPGTRNKEPFHSDRDLQKKRKTLPGQRTFSSDSHKKN